jgi:hypothetical protein
MLKDSIAFEGSAVIAIFVPYFDFPLSRGTHPQNRAISSEGHHQVDSLVHAQQLLLCKSPASSVSNQTDISQDALPGIFANDREELPCLQREGEQASEEACVHSIRREIIEKVLGL